MQITAIQQIIGLLLMLFSMTLLPPALVGVFYGDGAVYPFLISFIIILISGLVFWLPVRTLRPDLRLRDGFIIVVVFWVVWGLSGALPFALSANPHLSITDSVFEAVSALTTTGATVITNIDSLPHSILFYRQQLQ